jgi:muramoyltetrapeptide carboxypeptidase
MAKVPPLLAPGDTVRVIAPSGCFDRAVFEAGLPHLERAGLKVRFDEGLFTRHFYLAGDDARRLAELEAALAEPGVRALWTARGGYGATRILHHLEPARVRAAGRTLVGFSDATALHAVWSRAGLTSVHGANVTTLASWSDAARAELFELLFGTEAHTHQGRTAAPGPRVEGRLWGGNLTVLAAMAGTGALPRLPASILFIEDVGEKPYRLDRALTQLRRAGALEGVRGLVVGQLTDCDEKPAPAFEVADGQARRPRATALEAVAEALVGLELPVVTGLALGHEPHSRAVLLGGHAVLDPERGTLSVQP